MKKLIVTAADTSHALSLERLVNLCSELLPDFQIHVFDLGLTDDDLKPIKKPNVLRHLYNYEHSPDWHNIKINAGEYAWKPVCISRAANYCDGLLFWMDAGCLLKNSFEKEIEFTLKHGIYTSATRGTLAEYTDPRTLDALKISEKDRNVWRMRAASLLGFDLKVAGVRELISTWSSLAFNKEIFAPEGSSKHPKVKGDTNPQFNHRQDQSVFNALLLEYGFNEIGGRWGWINQQDIDNRPRNI